MTSLGDVTVSRRRLFATTGVGLAAAHVGVTARPAHAEDPSTQGPGEAGVVIHVDRWARVPLWSDGPSIDGTLSDAAWATAAVLSGFRTTFRDELVEDGPTYRLGRTATHLYVGGEFTASERETLALVEILVSTSGEGPDHQVVTVPVSPERETETEWDRAFQPRDQPARTDVDNYQVATDRDDANDRFSVEVAIPFASLGSSPTEGDEWRVNVIHVHNVNTVPLRSWYPIRTARYMDRSGGKVTWSGNVTDQGRLGSLLFDAPAEGNLGDPGNWQLTTTGFDSKTLTFTATPTGHSRLRKLYSPRVTPMQIAWKEADGPWLPLEIDQSADDDVVTLSFQHPAPRIAASYQLRVTADHDGSQQVVTILSFDREDLVRAGAAAQGFVPPRPAQTSVTPTPASPEVERLLGLIPPMPGFRFVGRPDRGEELRPDGLYTLSTDGERLVVAETGQPLDVDTYPETESLTVVGRDGQEREYTYHQDENGLRYFLSSHLWFLQKKHVVGQTPNVAANDPLGAARLLHRFTEVYPAYVPTTDEVWYNFLLDATSGPPYNYWGGVWDRWHLNDLSSLGPLLRAYGVVVQTDALQVLSDELGVDVEQRLVEGMFLPSADYLFSYPVTLANMDFSIWAGLIAMGKALGDPDPTHRAISWIEDYTTKRHLSDGGWFEVALSYHRQSTNGLQQAIDNLQGYTDPAGYVSPRTGVRFDNLDLSGAYPVLDRAFQISRQLVYPDSRTFPLKDTWASTAIGQADLAAGSFVLPASGVARLTRGEGDDQEQVYLGFPPLYGHDHADALNLSLWARGQELLPDLGYTHSKRRYFAISTLGHNTVVVDAANTTSAGAAKHGGAVEQFVVNGAARITRANQSHAYAVTSEYSRELWHIPFDIDGDQGYVLDLFRVSGGQRHEYTLNGDANRDAYFLTEVEMSPYGDRLLPPGVTAVEATHQGESGSAEGHYPAYIYVRDVQRGEPDGGYEVTLATFDSTGARACLGVIGTAEAGDELFLGRAPSLRTTRLYGSGRDNNDDVELYDLPKLVHRREGSNLASTFVTTLEPHAELNGHRIEAVDRLPITDAPAGAVAVQISHGNVIDLVVSNPRHPQSTITGAGTTVRGELGLIRMVDGQVSAVQLVGGTELTVGPLSVSGAGEVTGLVTGTMQRVAGDDIDALVVDAPVPAEAAGHHVVVTHPDGRTRAFLVGEVTSSDGSTVLVLADQDPGFAFGGAGGSHQTSYPGTRWPTGTHSWRIALLTEWDGPATDPQLATGTVTGTVTGPDDAPFTEASVAVSGLPGTATTTAADGTYTLTGVPVGTRHVTVSKEGFLRTVSAAGVVTDGGSVVLDLRVGRATPPVLSEVTGHQVVGGQLGFTCSVACDLHIVPTGTVPIADAIVAASAEHGLVVPEVDAGSGQFSTNGLGVGTWVIHALDQTGGVSTAVGFTLVPQQVDAVDDGDPLVQYSGAMKAFSNSNYYGGTVKRLESAGATVEIPFHGTGFAVLATSAVDNGFVEIHCDGELLDTVDTYAASPVYQREVFRSGTLTEGVHVVTIVATGEKRSAARNAYFTFDAVLVD